MQQIPGSERSVRAVPAAKMADPGDNTGRIAHGAAGTMSCERIRKSKASPVLLKNARS
ncbi:MAG: hypothetical protein ACOH1P_09505 [Lysobacter sp.]